MHNYTYNSTMRGVQARCISIMPNVGRNMVSKISARTLALLNYLNAQSSLSIPCRFHKSVFKFNFFKFQILFQSVIQLVLYSYIDYRPLKAVLGSYHSVWRNSNPQPCLSNRMLCHCNIGADNRRDFQGARTRYRWCKAGVLVRVQSFTRPFVASLYDTVWVLFASNLKPLPCRSYLLLPTCLIRTCTKMSGKHFSIANDLNFLRAPPHEISSSQHGWQA